MPSTPFIPWKEINLKDEILAGLTVAMTMIPESLAFAILAGLSPLTGLYAAFIMGIITAIFGGRPGMISGGAGATVIVMISLIKDYGVEYLFAAVIVAGIIQLLVGIFKWGKFVSLIPQPVMYGFLNGLAVVIFMAQIEQFKITENGITEWMSGSSLYIMIGLTLLTIAVVTIFPKISKAIPATLIAILATMGVVYFGNIETKKVMDIASVSGHLPTFHIPNITFSWETLWIILPYSGVMAAAGMIESLLTLNMVDEITNTKGKPNKEALAQGSANILNGLFGGMGGCAMVAQTLVNLNSGAKSRLAGIIGAIAILLVILVASPFIEEIPMAALVGVMIIVAFKTFKWVSIRIINKRPISDILIGMIVAAITIFHHNLALAVFVGITISALIFAWESAKRIRARTSILPSGEKLYEIYGPLFFGSTSTFISKFNEIDDPNVIIIDFKESSISDMSAIESLIKIKDKYTNLNKRVILSNLNTNSLLLINNSEEFKNIEIK